LDVFDTCEIDFNSSSFISKMETMDEASVVITNANNIEQHMQNKHHSERTTLIEKILPD
jgi:hypothetical protein